MGHVAIRESDGFLSLQEIIDNAQHLRGQLVSFMAVVKHVRKKYPKDLIIIIILYETYI